MILTDEKLHLIGSGIKAVVCDLDATLLGADKLISAGNLAAIREAQKKGIFVSICSGRIVTQLNTYIKDLQIDGPVITTNGALLVDGKTGKHLWEMEIAHEAVTALCDFSIENDIDYCAFTVVDSYFTRNNPRIRNFELYNSIATKNGIPAVKLIEVDASSEIHGAVYKILLHSKSEEKLLLARDFLKTQPQVEYTIAEAGTIDIMCKGVDKGNAVKMLADIIGVKKEEIAAFGDYDNDLAMFREAGMPIAMGNACEMLKDNSVYVTDDYREDGVGKAIRRFML